MCQTYLYKNMMNKRYVSFYQCWTRWEITCFNNKALWIFNLTLVTKILITIFIKRNCFFKLLVGKYINIIKTTFDFNLYQFFKQQEYTKTWKQGMASP